jgi:hypothetical protein
MRHLLLIIILFQHLGAYCQNKLHGVLPLNENNLVAYEGVDSLPNKSKEDIYNRSKEWIFDAFKSGKNVLQLDDKETFTITGNGNFTNIWGEGLAPTDMRVSFKIKVIAKDNRYKYIVSDIYLDYSMDFGVGGIKYFNEDIENWQMRKGKLYREKNAVKYLTKLNEDILNLIESFKTYMHKESDATKKDW